MGPTEQEYRQALAWIEQLRTRVARLEAENGDLLRQLDELRRGVGVAVVIQGRAIPLAAPMPGDPRRQTGAPAVFPAPVSQPTPASYPFPSGPISAPYPSAYPYSAPLSSPLGGGTQTGRPAALSPESSWLTGQTPAVHPTGGGASSQRGGARRQTSPSQQMTPDWLREETQGGQPSTRHSQTPRSTNQMPAATPYPSASNARPRPRGGIQARPLGGSESGERLPSLAELTGHIPAVRGRAKLSKREREEYDDSFVLG